MPETVCDEYIQNHVLTVITLSAALQPMFLRSVHLMQVLPNWMYFLMV